MTAIAKIPVALAAIAVATASTLTLTSSAEAGGRGHFHFRHFHFSPPLPVPEPIYVPRRRVYVKPVVTRAPAAAPAPVVRYADGVGRQYDRASKTWFDGAGSCWKGDKSFSFRGDAWFYGNARWVQTSNGWGVSSGALPQQIDCAGIKAFEAKLKPASPAAQAPAAEAPKPVAAKEAPVRTAEPAPAVVEPKKPAATANASDCKKYLPSLGETVSVPCNQ